MLAAALIAPAPQHVRVSSRNDLGESSLQQVDGGRHYYERFPRSLPGDASYFPIGVWFESVLSQADVDADKQVGINVYVALTSNSDLRLIAQNGMHVIAQQDTIHENAAPVVHRVEDDPVWHGIGEQQTCAIGHQTALPGISRCRVKTSGNRHPVVVDDSIDIYAIRVHVAKESKIPYPIQ